MACGEINPIILKVKVTYYKSHSFLSTNQPTKYTSPPFKVSEICNIFETKSPNVAFYFHNCAKEKALHQ